MSRTEIETLLERISRMEDYIVSARERGAHAEEQRYLARHSELCAQVPAARLDTDLL